MSSQCHLLSSKPDRNRSVTSQWGRGGRQSDFRVWTMDVSFQFTRFLIHCTLYHELTIHSITWLSGESIIVTLTAFVVLQHNMIFRSGKEGKLNL
jgi:hypothetical protein